MPPTPRDAHVRRRWRPTPAQRQLLEAVFSVSNMPSRFTVDALATMLGVSSRQARIWFQNKRLRLRQQHGADAVPNSTVEGPLAAMLPAMLALAHSPPYGTPDVCGQQQQHRERLGLPREVAVPTTQTHRSSHSSGVQANAASGPIFAAFPFSMARGASAFDDLPLLPPQQPSRAPPSVLAVPHDEEGLMPTARPFHLRDDEQELLMSAVRSSLFHPGFPLYCIPDGIDGGLARGGSIGAV